MIIVSQALKLQLPHGAAQPQAIYKEHGGGDRMVPLHGRTVTRWSPSHVGTNRSWRALRVRLMHRAQTNLKLANCDIDGNGVNGVSSDLAFSDKVCCEPLCDAPVQFTRS